MCLVLCILNILKIYFKFNEVFVVILSLIHVINRSNFKGLEGKNHVMKNL